VEQSKELERPGAIVSNHVSYVDILYHMSASFPSFDAKVLQNTLMLICSSNCSRLCHLNILILLCPFYTCLSLKRSVARLPLVGLIRY
jgi:1-acyl-sn-glycerol-3-phosphate acyltransferase